MPQEQPGRAAGRSPDRCALFRHWLPQEPVYRRPVAAGDGHDFTRRIEGGVPGAAPVIDDVVVGFEDAARQRVLTQELPDVFLGIEFGRTRRQRDREVERGFQGLGAVPAGLVEDQNAVRARRDLGCDVIETALHSSHLRARTGTPIKVLRCLCGLTRFIWCCFPWQLGSGLSRVCGGLAQDLNLLAQKLDLPLNKLMQCSRSNSWSLC